MARIRTIKPDFWTDETVGECSPTSRLLFIGTWNLADDHGNLERSARQIKAQLFPYDNTDCEPLIQELLRSGLLIEYTVDDKKYLHIKGFDKHQKVEKKSNPKHPPFESSGSTPRVLPDSSPTSSGSSSGREGKGKGREEERRRAARADASPRFDPSTVAGLNAEAWALWTEHRTAIRKPIRPHALQDAACELAALGDQQLPAVRRARAGGWQGLHADSMKLNSPVNGSKPKPGTFDDWASKHAMHEDVGFG